MTWPRWSNAVRRRSLPDCEWMTACLVVVRRKSQHRLLPLFTVPGTRHLPCCPDLSYRPHLVTAATPPLPLPPSHPCLLPTAARMILLLPPAHPAVVAVD
eukprot:365106-Chlamydomonas_euryale.AAC.5